MKDNLIVAGVMALSTFVLLSGVLGVIYGAMWLAGFLGQYSPWLVAWLIILLFSAGMGVFTLLIAPGEDGEPTEDPPTS